MGSSASARYVQTSIMQISSNTYGCRKNDKLYLYVICIYIYTYIHGIEHGVPKINAKTKHLWRPPVATLIVVWQCRTAFPLAGEGYVRSASKAKPPWLVDGFSKSPAESSWSPRELPEKSVHHLQKFTINSIGQGTSKLPGVDPSANRSCCSL